jgi:hypothetical protein
LLLFEQVHGSTFNDCSVVCQLCVMLQHSGI